MTPDEALMAQRIDSATWTLRGSPQPLAAPVVYNGPSFLGGFDASLNGRVLTYFAGTDRGPRSIGSIGPGTARPSRTGTAYRGLRLSPDGRRVAVELADERYGTRDLWMLDTTTQSLSRLTSNNATDWRAVFSPDGSSLAFATDRAGVSTIMRTSTNGTGGESLSFAMPRAASFPRTGRATAPG